MNIINKSETNKERETHITIIGNIKNRHVKFVYTCHNAVEISNFELFDGNKWNKILTMFDIGYIPDSNTYISLNKEDRKAKAYDIYEAGLKIVKQII